MANWAELAPEPALLERKSSGIDVRVHYSDGQLWLLLADKDGPRIAAIPPDKAFDAFEHPYMYVAR